MSRVDDLQACGQRARHAGVPEHVVTWWLSLGRPRVVLEHVDHESAPADARIAGYHGGAPHLPEDVDWAGLPHYVASVDCAALPAIADLPLPEDGWLLFFGNKGEIDFNPAAWDTGGRVLYVPADTACAERSIPHDGMEEFEREPFPILQRLPLRQSFHWSFPDWESVDDESIGDAYELYEQFGLSDLSWDLRKAGTFALGGHPAIVHSDPCNWVREVCGDQDWRLLAETPNSFTDSYSGYIYWIIRNCDLIERRFDRVKTVMQGVA